MNILLLISLIIPLTSKADIPLTHSCKITTSLSEEYNSCEYKVGNDLQFGLMISQKTGFHTLTIYKQADFYGKKPIKYYLKAGNLIHTCLVIDPINLDKELPLFISVKDGSIVKNYSDSKCSK